MADIERLVVFQQLRQRKVAMTAEIGRWWQRLVVVMAEKIGQQGLEMMAKIEWRQRLDAASTEIGQQWQTLVTEITKISFNEKWQRLIVAMVEIGRVVWGHRRRLVVATSGIGRVIQLSWRILIVSICGDIRYWLLHCHYRHHWLLSWWRYVCIWVFGGLWTLW